MTDKSELRDLGTEGHARKDLEYIDGLSAHMDEGGKVSGKNVTDLIAMVRWNAENLITALAPTTQGTESEPETYAEWQQKRGRLADKKDEIVSILADHYDFRAQNGVTIDEATHKGAVNRIFAALTQPDTQGTDSGLAGERAEIWLYPEQGDPGAGEWFWTESLKDHDPDDVRNAVRYVRDDRTDRKAVLEEAAKVAEGWAGSCAQERGNAGAMNDRHRVWQMEAERLASLSIASSIRALAEGAGK